MVNTFKEIFVMLGGHCPVCGNDDHQKMVVASKKIVRGLEQIFFFCLGCGVELSKESKKACFACITRKEDTETKEIDYESKIVFEDLDSFITQTDPGEQESKSVMKVLTAWNIPLLSSPPKTGNE